MNLWVKVMAAPAHQVEKYLVSLSKPIDQLYSWRAAALTRLATSNWCCWLSKPVKLASSKTRIPATNNDLSTVVQKNISIEINQANAPA